MIEVATFILSLLLACAVVFLGHHLKKIADIVNQRKLAYEGEKGKNLATKEDIADITKQIETVKEEVSFVSQRKKDYVVERKRHLLNLLYYAEKISNGQNSLQLHAHGLSEGKGLYTLIDRINDTCLELTHEYHILIAEYDEFIDADAISNLVNNCSLLGNQIVTAAHNAAIAITQSNNCLEESRRDPRSKSHYMIEHLELSARATKIAKSPLLNKEAAENAINNYVVWLKDLFGQGLNFNYDILNLQFENINANAPGTVFQTEPSA